MKSGYLRFPDVNGDEVVFCADDDLWLTRIDGGTAWRLTHGAGPVARPRFSPDSTLVAFGSTLDGPGDIYVVDRRTGVIDRLTHVGFPVHPLCWLDDEHIAFSTAAWVGDGRAHRMYSVALDGSVERLPYGQGMGLAIHSGGAVATSSTNGRDSAAWKRYRGGMAAKLWLDPEGQGEWQPVLEDEEAGMYSPGWFGERLIFSADIGRVAELPQAQLWSVDATGADLQCHTHHTFANGYVRDPRTDGRSIVYHSRGSLYVMSSLDDEPRELTIELCTQPPRETIGAETIREWRVDQGCDGSLVEWRGAISYLTHRAGPARQLAGVDGIRYRMPRFLGTDGDAAWVSDEGGHDTLEIGRIDAGEVRRIDLSDLGFVIAMEPNPQGTRLACRSHDGRLTLVDVATGEFSEVALELAGESVQLTWSPDGRYLAWVARTRSYGYGGNLVAHDCEESVTIPLTSGAFSDFSPSFSRDGKYLLFLSARTLDPHFDSFTFDVGFAASVRPYLLVLDKTTPAPFGPSVDGWPVSQVMKARDKFAPLPDEEDAPETKDDTPRTTIDADGLSDRILALPVAAGDLSRLSSVKDGVVWLEHPRVRMLGTSRVDDDAPKPRLRHYSFTARKVTELADGVTSYAVDGSGTRLVIKSKTDYTVVPSDRKAGKDDDASIAIDLTRLRREVDLRSQWTQMLQETTRLQSLFFWREDMDGLDWPAMAAPYHALTQRLHSYAEFVDLGWEAIGELSTSHAYVMARPPASAAGLLGADLVTRNGGVWIERVLPGESSDPHATSPLLAPGVAAAAGMRIEAVGGQPVTTLPELGRALTGMAGKVVELTLGTDDGSRRVVVTPLDSEAALRYHDWTESRRRYVEEGSHGRLGYIHVPDMGPRGWAQLHRMIDKAMLADGVIVDVRYNGGGNTSQLVVERLGRRVRGWQSGRHIARDQWSSYPYQAPRGPVVVVTNEFAGSDGDIVSGAVQAMGIGPVVGVRSWGGVIGIDQRYSLIDGTAVTQPRYATWIEGYDWGLENHGADPDIWVRPTPVDWDSDVDVQLDVAIAEALRMLDDHPAAQPPQLPAPTF